MTNIYLLLAGLFLPLFPVSMPFNMFYAKLTNPALRSLLLFVWPQSGLFILSYFKPEIPSWVITLALFTSLFYALRALVLRDISTWLSFISTSTWALLWVILNSDNEANLIQLHLITLLVSIPLVLMSYLVSELDTKYGAAYLGLYSGLAKSMPRLSLVFVIVVLAIIATPVVPTFFLMLSLIIKPFTLTPVISFTTGIIWLFWSWSGARILQELITGSEASTSEDITIEKMTVYIIAVIALSFSGMHWSGEFL